MTERERQPGEGLDSLATRVEIIRYARDAFAEVGSERNVKALEGAILYGELALEGASGERLSKAAEAVPSKGNLIEQLNWASRQYREWGNQERTAACRRLSEYYARQLRAQREEGGEERDVDRKREVDRERYTNRKRGVERERDVDRKRDVEGNIEDLGRRIEILRFAHDALTRAGREKWALTMKRFLRVAKLQHEGAGDEAIARAAEGLSMGMTIELLQKASGFYEEWGWEGRAAACDQLAEFYAARQRGRTAER